MYYTTYNLHHTNKLDEIAYTSTIMTVQLITHFVEGFASYPCTNRRTARIISDIGQHAPANIRERYLYSTDA